MQVHSRKTEPTDISQLVAPPSGASLPTGPDPDKSPFQLAKAEGITIGEARKRIKDSRANKFLMSGPGEAILSAITSGLEDPERRSPCASDPTFSQCRFGSLFRYRQERALTINPSPAEIGSRWVDVSRRFDFLPDGLSSASSPFGILQEISWDILKRAADKGDEHTLFILRESAPELAAELELLSKQGITWELFTGVFGYRTSDGHRSDTERFSYVELALLLPNEDRLTDEFRAVLEQRQQAKITRARIDSLYSQASKALGSFIPQDSGYQALAEIPAEISIPVEKGTSSTSKVRKALLDDPVVSKVIEMLSGDGVRLTVKRVELKYPDENGRRYAWTIGG